MSFPHWFRFWLNFRPIGRKSAPAYLNLEFLEGRMLLASPISLTPIISSPVVNPVSSLTAPLLNSVTSLLNPVTSSVSPLLSSIINPLLGSPLPGSVLSPLVGPVISSLPQVLPTGTLGPVASLPPAIPLPGLLALNPSNLFQPRSTPAGTYSSPGSSGLGGTKYNPSSPSVIYYSAPALQPTYSGGVGEIVTPATLEKDLSSEVGSSRSSDAIVTVGLGDEDEVTWSRPGMQEILLAFDDDLSVPDLAATLLTGIRPRASLLPQRGSQVAPVATLLRDDAGDMMSETTFYQHERLDDLLINPAANYPRDPSLPIPSSEEKRTLIPAASPATMLPGKEKGKSSMTDLLMFGFVTAMMAFRALRSRRTDAKKNEKPALAV